MNRLGIRVSAARHRPATAAARMSIRAAQRRGDLDEVNRLNAQIVALQNGTFTPVGEPSDRLERLQKLADLHDRGVLTDAEFAVEKAKILGSA